MFREKPRCRTNGTFHMQAVLSFDGRYIHPFAVVVVVVVA